MSLHNGDSSNEMLEQILKEQILLLLDALKSMIGPDQNDLVYMEFLFKRFPNSALMEEVIRHVLPWKSRIDNREDDFFYKNKKIFGAIAEEKVDFFSDLWMNEHLTEEDKREIWDFFDTFVACAEEYKKRK